MVAYMFLQCRFPFSLLTPLIYSSKYSLVACILIIIFNGHFIVRMMAEFIGVTTIKTMKLQLDSILVYRSTA